MQPRTRPICALCEYFEPGVGSETGRPSCRAFPQGIPSEILNGGYDHRQPLADETITFKLRADASEEDLEEWEQEQLETQKADILTTIDQARAQEA